MAGWIKLHRDIEKHWVFKDDSMFKRWIDLIMMAGFEENKVFISGHLVMVGRGQLVWSQEKLSERWRCSRQETRTFLKNLENDGMIERDFVQKSNHKITIISICNYDKYQEPQTTSQPLANHKPTTSQPLANQEEELKELKELKETYIPANAGSEKPKINGVPYKDIETLYHECLPMLPQIYKWTETRKRRVKALWHSELEEINHWRNYFNDIARSKFLTGRAQGKDGRTWKADFDFIINESNFIKIAEGKYSDQKI